MFWWFVCDKRSMIGAGSVCACFHNSNFANEKVSPYICERREPTSILFYSCTNYLIWCLIAITVWPFCFSFFPILCQDRPKTIKPAQADEVHACVCMSHQLLFRWWGPTLFWLPFGGLFSDKKVYKWWLCGGDSVLFPYFLWSGPIVGNGAP